jgi:hypothetical protein
MNWQPIETAPKDGTKVLVYEERLGIMHVASLQSAQYGELQWLVGEFDYDFPYLFTQPSHWMPLPEPPK